MAPMVTATLSSSSTTRSLPFGMVRRTPDRQRHAEGRAPTLATAQLDRAAMRLHDALGNPEAEPGPFFVLGGKERFEDVRQVLLGDALARIADLDMDRVGHQ